ncbi:uncharacterized protein LOC132258872 [Phlebotomus argentipes]|uniref:uncharacterized protein LOC132258872 n=1 Tax=Phlebotomus argentipes TaxID=94469 RepID=UPI002892ABED|nr:uncharacterized protein LOC132258872 [Phlebotomus argentipes]
MTTLKEKRDAFRQYLEECGIIGFLTRALTRLYEMKERPEDGIEFLKQMLEAYDKTQQENVAILSTPQCKESSPLLATQEKKEEALQTVKPIPSKNIEINSTPEISGQVKKQEEDILPPKDTDYKTNIVQEKKEESPAAVDDSKTSVENSKSSTVPEASSKVKERESAIDLTEEKEKEANSADNMRESSHKSILESAISRHKEIPAPTHAPEHRDWSHKPNETSSKQISQEYAHSGQSTRSHISAQQAEVKDTAHSDDSFESAKGPTKEFVL